MLAVAIRQLGERSRGPAMCCLLIPFHPFPHQPHFHCDNPTTLLLFNPVSDNVFSAWRRIELQGAYYRHYH